MSIEMQDAVLTIVVALLGLAIRWIAKRIDANDTKTEALEAIVLAVSVVRQTYVDDLKAANADGNLTDAEKAEARRRAVETAMKLVGPKAAALLAEWGEARVRAYVEAAVAKR